MTTVKLRCLSSKRPRCPLFCRCCLLFRRPKAEPALGHLSPQHKDVQASLEATSAGSSLGSHVQLRPAVVSGASAVAPRAGCQCARVATETVGGRKICIVSDFPHAMLHAHRPLESGPRAAQWTQRAGSHASHDSETSTVTKGPAWYPTAVHSCALATSDTNESLHPEIELQHVAN
jgi:hypothetical protein